MPLDRGAQVGDGKSCGFFAAPEGAIHIDTHQRSTNGEVKDEKTCIVITVDRLQKLHDDMARAYRNDADYDLFMVTKKSSSKNIKDLQRLSWLDPQPVPSVVNYCAKPKYVYDVINREKHVRYFPCSDHWKSRILKRKEAAALNIKNGNQQGQVSCIADILAGKIIDKKLIKEEDLDQLSPEDKGDQVIEEPSL